MTGKLVNMKFVPGKVVSWEDFIATHPPYSIALDGYVHGITRYDASGPWWNANHHEECVRAATRCTCKQVLNAVRTGLFEAFKHCGRPHATVWCNDPDEDVALATYVLRHPSHVNRKRLREIVELEDLLDTVNGFYPVQRRWHLLKMMIWFLHPYAEARENGTLHSMDGEQMAALMEVIHGRIKKTMYGRGGEEEPDTRYVELDSYQKKLIIVKEIGHYARYRIAREGYQSFLTFAERPDGNLQCTLARRSPFIAWMPLDKIRNALNEAEGVPAHQADKDGWGGSDLAIGSPRKRGTKLTVETITSIIVATSEEQETRMCHVGQRKR